MIFLTVGSQMPFDRLVLQVDEWALATGIHGVAQVGESALQTRALHRESHVTPARFRELVSACDLLIGHAGMGTVLTGLEFGKPMILFPRLGALRETRNDHQVATLKWLGNRAGIYPAFDAGGLAMLLNRVATGVKLDPPAAGDESASSLALQATLRAFILEQ